jgi:hypothetical protein
MTGTVNKHMLNRVLYEYTQIHIITDCLSLNRMHAISKGTVKFASLFSSLGRQCQHSSSINGAIKPNSFVGKNIIIPSFFPCFLLFITQVLEKCADLQLPWD